MPEVPELVRADVADGVRQLTLNRPGSGNALSADLRAELLQELEDVEDDLSVRALILTAAGERHFCTGADLRAPRPAPRVPAGGPERPVGGVVRGLERGDGAQRLFAAVMDCRVPVVAAVNGTAAGIGVQLALACDLVVARAGAVFSQIAVRRGIVPDGGAAYLLPRLVGLQRAKELLLLGDDLLAEEAHAIGLVNRVVPSEDLLDVAQALAGRLASGPTVTLGLTKRLVNASFESDRAASLRNEALAEEVAMATHDGSEGFRAFVERRPVDFRGW